MEKVSKPLISIIVPVYNSQDYIKKCLNSIINQSYDNIEIIIVDDGSNDKSLEIIKELALKDKRIIVLNQKNSGVSSARNKGMEIAKGQWISFVDSDDWIEKDYCQVMLDCANKYNADYVCCGYKRVYNNHIELINSDGKILEYKNSKYLLKLLNVQNCYGFCHMKLINKKIIKDIKFNENIKVGEDALFNVELCNNCSKMIVVNKPLYNYYFNSTSVVRKYDENYVTKYLNSMILMSEYIDNMYSLDKSVLQNLYNYVAYHVLLIAVNYCYHPLNKNKKKSLRNVCNNELFKKSIKNSNYDNMSITRKITLFTIKHKLYFITGLICKYRQRQFKK